MSNKIFFQAALVLTMMGNTGIMAQDTTSLSAGSTVSATGGSIDSARNTAINTNSDGSPRDSSGQAAKLYTASADSTSISNGGDTGTGFMHRGIGKYGLLGLFGLLGLLGLRRRNEQRGS